MLSKMKKLAISTSAFFLILALFFLLWDATPVLPQGYPTPTPRSEVTHREGLDTLAVFDGYWTSLISTLDDYADGWNVQDYPLHSPFSPFYDVDWLMGDWDGDGQKSPGVYGNGPFYYTNLLEGLEVREDWLKLGVWVGPEGQAVAGHFRSDITNDCIGVVEEATSATGTIYVLWYTCDFNVEVPLIESQLIGKILPKVKGLMDFGTPQFVVGDWDSDGIETIAFRQGRLFNYSNTPPTEDIAVFNERVMIGLPRHDGYGILVAGDWDDDGIDTIGLYYFYATWAVNPDGVERHTPFHEFYYCNTLVCSDEGYVFIRVSTTLDPTYAPEFLNVVSWRDNRPPPP